MAYLYRHIRNDKNQVFYVGVGKDNKGKYSRAYSKNRNQFWKRIVEKTNYEVEIMFEHEDYSIILEKEVEFIRLYGRKDLGLGELCNLTDGGEGASNMSQAGRERLRQLRLGVKITNKERLKRYSELASGGNNARALKVIHKNTFQVFDCIMDAAVAYGLNKRTLIDNLNGKNCNHSDFFYLKDYEEKGLEKCEEERLAKIKEVRDAFSKAKREQVVSKETRKKQSVASRKSANSEKRLAYNLKRKLQAESRTESHCNTCNTTKSILDFYKGKLHICKECHKEKTAKKRKKRGKSILVINTKTKEIFKTTTDAAKSINMNRASLVHRLSGAYKNDTDFMYLRDCEEKVLEKDEQKHLGNVTIVKTLLGFEFLFW